MRASGGAEHACEAAPHSPISCIEARSARWGRCSSNYLDIALHLSSGLSGGGVGGGIGFLNARTKALTNLHARSNMGKLIGAHAESISGVAEICEMLWRRCTSKQWRERICNGMRTSHARLYGPVCRQCQLT